MYRVSIIIFFLNSGFNLIKRSETQPSLLREYGSVVRVTHCFHDHFLSASLKGWSVVIHTVSELSFILSSSSEKLLFSLPVIVFGCLLSEEVVTMEEPISVDGSTTHPNGSDSTKPPLISFENEVSVVKHFFLYKKLNLNG